MPPRWPREPDRGDPAYRKLEDRINFAVHVATYAAGNSGLWFFHIILKSNWPWLIWLSGIWAASLAFHLLYILLIADYSVTGVKPD